MYLFADPERVWGLSLPLYKGEGVAAAVASFVQRHGLSEQTVAGLVTEVGRRAAANGHVPFVTVPSSLPQPYPQRTLSRPHGFAMWMLQAWVQPVHCCSLHNRDRHPL
jgi:hypothetical protein